MNFKNNSNVGLSYFVNLVISMVIALFVLLWMQNRIQVWNQVKRFKTNLLLVSVDLKKSQNVSELESVIIFFSILKDDYKFKLKILLSFLFFLSFSCLYYVYNHQIWRELWRTNWYLLLLKCFEQKSGSWKVWLTVKIFILTPPIMKN